MHHMTDEVIKLMEEKGAIDYIEADRALNMFFKAHDFEDYTKAQMVASAMIIISVLDLELEDLERVTLNTSSFELSQLLRLVIGDEAYEHYMDLLYKELEARFESVAARIAMFEKQAEEVSEEFEKEIDRLEKLLD